MHPTHDARYLKDIIRVACRPETAGQATDSTRAALTVARDIAMAVSCGAAYLSQVSAKPLRHLEQD